mgnify:CR=1 FL=1
MTKEILYTVSLSENSSFKDKCLYVTLRDIVKENKITKVSFDEETDELEIRYIKTNNMTNRTIKSNITKFAEVNRILLDEGIFSLNDSITDYNEDPITERQKLEVREIYLDNHEYGRAVDPDYNLVETFLEEGIGLNTKALVEYYRELQGV